MRHLTEAFAIGALRRGRSIEQFLGAVSHSERPGVRWVEITPAVSGFRVIVHLVEDIGGEHFCDLVEFPPLDLGGEESFGVEVAVVDSPGEALAIAGAETGADVTRWVNEGMAGHEYQDFVRAGRPRQVSGARQPEHLDRRGGWDPRG